MEELNIYSEIKEYEFKNMFNLQTYFIITVWITLDACSLFTNLQLKVER